MYRKILRYGAAAVFVATGAGVAHLAVLGKVGAGGMLAAILSAIAAGLSLSGRFEWPEIGALLSLLGTAAREIAGTAAKLSAFVKGLLWCGLGLGVGRLVYVVFGSSLLSFEGGAFELMGWCGVGGTAICFAKCAADWSVAFKPSAAKLDNENVHGRAGKATQARAKSRAQGTPPRPSWADQGHID